MDKVHDNHLKCIPIVLSIALRNRWIRRFLLTLLTVPRKYFWNNLQGVDFGYAKSLVLPLHLRPVIKANSLIS